MKIRAICRTHPNSAVLLLAATTQFVKNNVPEYCAEEDEKAIGIELDEANLYCTSGDTYDHDTDFVVVENWPVAPRL